MDRHPPGRRTALLDLDGTLTDSAALITEHLAAALVDTGGPPLPPERLRPMVGPPLEESLAALGLPPALVAAAILAFRRSYERVAATHTPLYPGVPALLDRLRAAGLRLALATAKPETTARSIVAGIGIAEYFEVVAGADPAAGRIDKAGVVGSVLQRLALDPARAPVLMVGDRAHDVHGAAAFGVPTIGVDWGYAGPGELRDAAAVVSDLDQLGALLTGDEIWSVAASGQYG